MNKKTILEWFCSRKFMGATCDQCKAINSFCDNKLTLSKMLDEFQADIACSMTRAILGNEIIKKRKKMKEGV